MAEAKSFPSPLRFSRDRPRFNDTLDVIKFLCKDLWTLVFKKQIDTLKTNHRGVYVLTDNSFRPLSRMSTDAGGQAVVRAQPVSVPPSCPLFLLGRVRYRLWCWGASSLPGLGLKGYSAEMGRPWWGKSVKRGQERHVTEPA
jgi:hypothetical protein